MRTIVTILLLIGALAAVAIGGCIRRYPAPTEPVEATMPYSAIATWRGLQLPPAAEPSPALPLAALRIAVGPDSDTVYADSALLDDASSAAIAEDWEGAMELLEGRSEPIVLLVDRSLLGSPERSPCRRLEAHSARVLVAAGSSGHGADGPVERASEDGLSRDPLGRLSLAEVCPAAEAP